MLRYHLDENVDFALARALRQRQIDVATTPPHVLKHASDEQQLAFALMESRVIISHDTDMLILHSKRVAHAGICYCAQKSRTISQLVARLLLHSRLHDPEDMFGQVEYL